MHAFRTFEPLAQAIGRQLAGRSADLDGEIGSCCHARAQSVLEVEYVESGSDLLRVICKRDMDRVVKQASARHRPDAATWVNIKALGILTGAIVSAPPRKLPPSN